MGLLHRRYPLYARPLPFLLGTAVAVAGLRLGLAWDWDWSLQTGNVFVLLLLPRSIVSWEPAHVVALSVAAAGSWAAWTWGLQGRRALEQDLGRPVAGWRRASFRIFPNTFLFGLFLIVFGCAFLFDASVYGDETPEGLAAFVYLDYAGLFHRPVATTLGLLVLGTGFACATRLSFEPGLGVPPAPFVAAAAPTAAASLPVPRLPTPVPSERQPATRLLSSPGRPDSDASQRPAASPMRVLAATRASRPRADAGEAAGSRPRLSGRGP